jgi:hypothetical protein
LTPLAFIYFLIGFTLLSLALPLAVAVEAPIIAARLIDGIDASNEHRFKTIRRILYPLLAISYVAFLILTWKHVRFAEWTYIGPLFLAPYVYLVAAPPARRTIRNDGGER